MSVCFLLIFGYCLLTVSQLSVNGRYFGPPDFRAPVGQPVTLFTGNAKSTVKAGLLEYCYPLSIDSQRSDNRTFFYERTQEVTPEEPMIRHSWKKSQTYLEKVQGATQSGATGPRASEREICL